MMPYVEEEWETIRTIIRNSASISRFGDGEMRVAVGRRCKTQEGSPELAKKLQKILKAPDYDGRFLVGIPRVWGRYDLKEYRRKTYDGWQRYTEDRFTKLLVPDKKYYSAFITRPDSAFHIDCDAYWELCQEIWKGRDVVLVQGNRKHFSKSPQALARASSVNIILGPDLNAFSDYERLMAEVLEYPANMPVILSLGTCATVMAYDLFLENRWALDLGHWGLFFTRTFIKGYGIEE